MPKKINVKGPIVGNDTAWFYNYLGWDCTSPKTISKALEEANGEEVILEINSPGGLVMYGYEMYTNLMEYKGKITAHIITAASAATLLACAADEVLISDAGIYMVHNAQGRADGDYRDVQQEADTLREIDEGIINVYVRKTGMDREKIQELMDQTVYMSPKTAIQYGFVDGYMFGDPDKKEEKEDTHENFENLLTTIAAADAPVIPENKARELITLIKNAAEGKVAPVQMKEQDNGGIAVSENKKEGEAKMTLKEFLAENPEANEELHAFTETAKAEGKNEERARLKSLDAIAETVTKEALNDAKYGEKPMDGPTLAYQAMLNGETLAKSYMEKAMADSKDSKVKEVGMGKPDAGEKQTNEEDDMAAYVNKTKGGR